MKMLMKEELARYILRQLDNMFYTETPPAVSLITKQFAEAMNMALERAEYCFKRVLPFSRFISHDGGEFRFYHLHADMYATFLCYLQNNLYENFGDIDTCDRLLQLNRMLHGFMCSYKCKLPRVVFLCHPLGTVLGNAQYSDYLTVLQNVTVSTSEKSTIGKGVYLTAGTLVLPDVSIGDRCLINNNVIVRNAVPPDSTLFLDGESGGQRLRNYDMTRVLKAHFIEQFLVEDGIICS